MSTAHETIHIEFTAGNRRYLACGYLKTGESSVGWLTMIRRTEVEGTESIDDEDWEYLCLHLADLSMDFHGALYLVSARCDPHFSHIFDCLRRNGEQWRESTTSSRSRFGDRGLVLRRYT